MHSYQNLDIEVFDLTYQFESSDNKFNYLIQYSSVDEGYQPTSKHGIKIYKDGKKLSSLPDLNLTWKIKADEVTCLGIYALKDDYIVYGELGISRVKRKGSIEWKYGGPDIFVITTGEEAFTLNTDDIAVVNLITQDIKSILMAKQRLIKSNKFAGDEDQKFEM